MKNLMVTMTKIIDATKNSMGSQPGYPGDPKDPTLLNMEMAALFYGLLITNLLVVLL